MESEVELGFSGLLDLPRPVLDRAHFISASQAAALRGALALGPPAGDRLAVAAATLSLLAVVCEQQPLLILVDDAHWLDESSEQAVVFLVVAASGDEHLDVIGPALARLDVCLDDLAPCRTSARRRRVWAGFMIKRRCAAVRADRADRASEASWLATKTVDCLGHVALMSACT